MTNFLFKKKLLVFIMTSMVKVFYSSQEVKDIQSHFD